MESIIQFLLITEKTGQNIQFKISLIFLISVVNNNPISMNL